MYGIDFIVETSVMNHVYITNVVKIADSLFIQIVSNRNCHVSHSIRLAAATCLFHEQTRPSASEVSPSRHHSSGTVSSHFAETRFAESQIAKFGKYSVSDQRSNLHKMLVSGQAKKGAKFFWGCCAGKWGIALFGAKSLV